MFEHYKYKVKLVKVYNDHKRLRDDEIEGFCDSYPEEGRRFIMHGPPRDGGAFRHVNTSPVVKMMKTGEVFEIHTESGSVYHLFFSPQ